MHIKILLICEEPTKNSRKAWAAEWGNYGARNDTVYVRWGRIPRGSSFRADEFARYAQQRKEFRVANEEAAEKFIDQKVREKAKKGYQAVIHLVDGVDFAMFSDRQPDERGRIKMKTYNGY